ncbi:MAG: cytochrome P450 [Actinocrinis sp.]
MKSPKLDVNFFDRAIIADPFPYYEQIRALGPVVWNEFLHGWMLTGYDDCTAVLGDTGGRFVMMNSDPEIFPWFEDRNMITVDGAAHHRLRTCLAPLFTRRAVAHWERRVGEVVDELLAPVAQGGVSFDLIADFTQVPTIIVAEMLGVPRERHDDFMRWSSTIAGGLAYGHEDAAARARLKQASAELNGYLREEIARHRRELPDDLFTTILRAADAGSMTDDEVRSTAVLMMAAGYDTTAKLLSNALVAFEVNPGQRDLLIERPELVPDAVEEVLRWTGVTQAIPRAAVVDTELAGQPIAAGDAVFALVTAAGRDPQRWADPLRFDVTRERKTNYGFGYGPHLCLGLHLARLEAKVAIERLLDVAGKFRLRDLEYGSSFFVRGPERGVLDIPVRA